MKRKTATLTQYAIYPNLPSHQTNQLFADCQSQATAPITASGGVICLGKGLE
ncbi:MAG: hypothetical protein OQK12_06500 [Motiliproteus sp.]|nr:hypothetical protein [Motiliproteus sp.]